MKARLYLDEDVSPELARVLCNAGYDAVAAQELEALGLTDEQQLERAASDERVLVSFNYRDFIHLAKEWAVRRKHLSGIVISYRQYGRGELRSLRRRLIHLLDAYSAEEINNTLLVLDRVMDS